MAIVGDCLKPRRIIAATDPEQGVVKSKEADICMHSWLFFFLIKHKQGNCRWSN